MPLYRYRCNECGHEFTKRQRFSDDPLTECPVCVGEVRRVINSVGIVFKGSGFYVTDNRNGSSAALTRRNGDGASGEGAAAEGGSGEAVANGKSNGSASEEGKAPKKESKKAESKSAASASTSAS